MDNIKHIFFDLDGTLSESGTGIINSVNYALNKINIDIKDTDVLKCFIGPPLMDSFVKYCNISEEAAEEAIKYYREYFTATGMFENKVYDGIEKMLIGLKKADKKLYVATSKPKIYSEKILNYFDLLDFFEFVSGVSLDGKNPDGTRTKKSDVIKKLIVDYKLDKSEVIMVGDKSHDIIGAKNNGIKSIGVLYGYGSYDELKIAGADYIVKDSNELLSLLE